MKKHPIRILTAILLFLFFDLHTQNPISFNHYTVHDGLLQQQVMAVYQDDRGFLWIGSKRGVSRFDGKEFKNYHQADGLSSGSQITGIWGYQDSLLIVDTHLSTYQFDGVRFSPIPFFDSLQTKRIQVIKPPFIYYSEMGICGIYNMVTQKKEIAILKNDSIPITQLAAVRDQIYFIDANHNFGYLDEDTKPITGLSLQTNSTFLTVGKDTYILKQSGKSTVYQHVPDLTTTTLIHRKKITIKNSKLTPEYIHFDRQLYRYDPKQSAYRPFCAQEYHNLWIDKDRTLWLGTEDGLYHYFPNFQFRGSRPFQDIWSVVYDSLENNYHLFYYDRPDVSCDKNGRIDTSSILPKNTICYYGSISSGKKMFISTSQNLIIRKPDKSQQTIYPTSFKEAPIYVSIPLANRSVLSATRQELIKTDTNYQSTSYFIPDSISKGHGYVRALVELPNQDILLGNRYGVIRWNPQANTFQTATIRSPQSVNNVLCLDIDSQQQIWMGSDIGLFLSKDAGKTFERVLPYLIDYEPITAITTISDSLILVGTSIRLLAIDPRSTSKPELTFKTFGSENGFKGIEVTQNGIKNFGDEIWIPSISGLTIINKNDWEFKTQEFDNLWIEAINGRPLTFTENKRKEFRLPKDEGNLRITFTAIGANIPNDKMYAYKIPELDTSWSDWTSDKVAVFNNLKSGIYTFCLRKKNTTNNDDSDEIQFKVTVKNHFYKEPDFSLRLLIVGLAIGLISLSFYIKLLYEKKIKDEQIIIATKEKEKAEQKAKSEAELKELKETKLQDIRHYARRALLLTAMTMEDEASFHKKQGENIIYSILMDAKLRVNSFIAVFDLLRNSQSSQLALDQYIANLTKELKNAGQTESFQIKFNIDAPQINMQAHRLSDLGAIIVELILNSYQHARPKDDIALLEISIKIESLDTYQYQLTYQDNGPGIPKETNNTYSLGRKLIQENAQTLNGSVVFEGSAIVKFYLSKPLPEN